MLPGHISPDGLWVWNGSAWVPTTSPDGRWRWNGYQWMPLPPAPGLGAAATERAATTRVLVLAGCIVALIGVLAIAAIAASGRRDTLVPGGAAALPTVGSVPGYPGAPLGTQVYPVPSRNHTVGRVEYAQTPPLGGEHAPVWLNCGIYDQPVPNENAVHSLEHGVVWVTYDPDRLDAAAVATLRQVVTAHYDGTAQRYLILSPFNGLPAPVVASAWGVQLRLGSAADPRLPQFIDYFRQGPETPELAGRCTGGVGRPIDGGGASGPVTLRPRPARGAAAL